MCRLGKIASGACMRVRICLTGNDGSDKRGDSQRAMRGRRNRSSLQPDKRSNFVQIKGDKDSKNVTKLPR